jgi:hypothetical protein
MLKKALIAVSALAVTLVSLTLVVLLGTVTHADAIGYSDWVEATKVTAPLPGQLYVVSDRGEVVAQLCQLGRNDFAISKDSLPGRTFVNRLGEAVPAVLWIAQAYFQTDAPADGLDIGYRLQWRSLQREFAPRSALNTGVRRVLQERDREALERDADLRRLEDCANAILDTFAQGQDVCQLTEVIKETGGRVLAVRFATHCLADPERGARPLPTLEAGSVWTHVKLGLGLVDQLLALPQMAGSAAS